MTAEEKIDKKLQGWGLKLDDDERKRILGHMLWKHRTTDGFLQECVFVFNGPMILLKWEENERSVSIVCDDRRFISASV